MGDGHLTQTKGLCHGLEVELEGGNFKLDAHLFELQDIKMIPGISWLASLGEILVDWGDQVMKIKILEGIHILKGMMHSKNVPTTLKAMIEDKSEMQGKDMYELSPKQNELMQKLLGQFDAVF